MGESVIKLKSSEDLWFFFFFFYFVHDHFLLREYWDVKLAKIDTKQMCLHNQCLKYKEHPPDVGFDPT